MIIVAPVPNTVVLVAKELMGPVRRLLSHLRVPLPNLCLQIHAVARNLAARHVKVVGEEIVALFGGTLSPV
jgi:hypothetical protein